MSAAARPLASRVPRPRSRALPPPLRPGRVAPRAIDEREVHSEVARRDRTFRHALLGADLVAALAGLAVAWTIGAPGLDPAVLLLLPLTAVAGKVAGLYDRDELVIRKTSLDELPRLLQLSALYTLVVWLADGTNEAGWSTALEVAVLWGTLAAAAFGGRLVARRVAARITVQERCLFVGDAATYARFARKVSRERQLTLVGRMSFQRPTRTGTRTAEPGELGDVLAWTCAHRVLIEPQALPAETMHELLRIAKRAGVRVSLLPRVLDVVGTSVVFDELGGMTVLGVRGFRLTRSALRTKRAFDVVAATVGVVTLAPVMVATAIALALDGGPILVRDWHVGRDGRPFRCLRFRRAAWMRRSELDALPQLFSVLAGHMSLVGPPPLAVRDGRPRGRDRRRLTLPPGMTGYWHVAGRGRAALQDVLKIDYLYVAGWSVWSDLKILLRSLRYLLDRR